jgi:hypothetical protein
MTAPPVTAVEAALQRRRRWTRPLALLALLALLVGIVAIIAGLVGLRTYFTDRTARYDDPLEHFKYGSIGSEVSGLPYRIWMTLPHAFPEAFDGRGDYSAFGFLYETAGGERRDLPIGISRRTLQGIDRVWFNCAVCHTGTWRTDPDAVPEIVAGMPANNLDLHGFTDFVLSIATDERMAPDRFMESMREAGFRFGPVEALVWKHVVLPQVREGLISQRARLGPLLALQPEWGPGRVDTFNPYKVIHLGVIADDMPQDERIGAADFPSIFLQAPREGMQLHWDGNNTSLAERNLSAAIGAGVTPDSVDHAAIGRIADWIGDLLPPPSPIAVDPALAERGRPIYAEACAACHGTPGPEGYLFEGERLGLVELIGAIDTDRARLDSYTEAFRDMQLRELFAGTPHQFRSFVKTDGYANMPLDGLWLRGPFLHNGSVPTLAALLKPPAERPVAFLRGSDVLDIEQGGFVSPACVPDAEPDAGFCFDTRLAGNGNGGHVYGVDLSPEAKADLLSYLKTF